MPPLHEKQVMNPSPTAAKTEWRWVLILMLYRLAGPLLLLIALPSWLRKMSSRGGWSTPLRERFTCYWDDIEWEPCNCIHYHAVSVGETQVALKLLRAVRLHDPSPCVLAVSTATAYHLAIKADIANLRILYAPIDLYCFVFRYLSRFQPSRIVLIEAEAWPELMQQCATRRIPVAMINARLSSRSEKCYQKFRRWVQPLFRKISLVAVQGEEDIARFATLGIERERIHLTGSIKFDPASDRLPLLRMEFANLLNPLHGSGKIVLAASTHDGEEILIGKAVRAAGSFFVCVPRHAERREQVKTALEQSGFEVVLRSRPHHPENNANTCLVIDSTGELKDWTAHADLVIIGKSFLAHGGQNPCEAIMAGKVTIFGPHMENFEPLASSLVSQNAAVQVDDAAQLSETIERLLASPSTAASMAENALRVIRQHEQATERTMLLLGII